MHPPRPDHSFFRMSAFCGLLLAWLLAPVPVQAANTARIALPPPGLAAWYKPQNKRQVWLHTMFRIGQSSAAVALYAEAGDMARLVKWADILNESYGSLATMVPVWREELDEAAAQGVAQAARAGDLAGVRGNLKKLRQTCRSCHGTYRTGVIALLRAADFSRVTVAGGQEGASISHHEAMKGLRDHLTALKIAREDGALEVARASTDGLKRGLTALAESCSGCHRDAAPRARILGEQTFRTLDALGAALTEPHDSDKSGRLLGEIGFTVCGRCHAIHRNQAEIRELLEEAARNAAP